MNWTCEEYKAYLLLTMAHSDMIITDEEKDYIIEKVGLDEFKHVQEEFDKDSDYQSAQKLMAASKHYCSTEEKRDEIYQELKEIAQIDGKLTGEEEALLLYLKRLLK